MPRQALLVLMLPMPSLLPTPPLYTDGEILKHNMMMHISSGPTLTDKVVSIDLLSRFRKYALSSQHALQYYSEIT